MPFSALLALLVSLAIGVRPADAEPSPARMTATVRAVQKARPAVVNIHGQKTVSGGQDTTAADESPRRVNGMGTGIVIDERGYIVTNHHVVEGVRRINVTLADGSTQIARLVEHDRATDLAVIKIDMAQPLEVIDVGTSSDLMQGEPVVAVGNAFGYEHTVTTGIVSALHRNVQISDAQTYVDLIQTNASINPGNSGGPLLNIDGQMIGINVAVRSGAQGIGFAIPVDQAMEVTARLLSVRRLENTWHGVVARNTTVSGQGLVVDEIEDDSPASRGGLKAGDRITAVGPLKVNRALDLERAFLGHRPGEELELSVLRRDKPLALKVVLEESPGRETPTQRQAWDVLGLRLAPIPPDRFDTSATRYRGGLTVTDVRPGSPADEKGIRRGDVLVGMHVWETVSLEDVQYIISQTELQAGDPVKFYILRDNRPFYGFVSLAQHGR